jgi:hypothetical protein
MSRSVRVDALEYSCSPRLPPGADADKAQRALEKSERDA